MCFFHIVKTKNINCCMKKKKVWFVLRRVIAGVVAVILFIFLPFVGEANNENMSFIYNVFVGAKSKYQGILEIWNIDTFETGKKSKTSLLTEIGNVFQKKNKGVYLMVRNVTENECLNLLKDGAMPDLFSCSYGVAEKIKDYTQPISSNCDGVAENLLTAGKVNDVQMAVPWCFGSYYLISTQSALEKAGKVEFDSLVNIALDCGYEKHNKKNTSVVYSLVFGMGKYLCPQTALSSYYDKGALKILNNSINLGSVSGTSYSAYCRYVAGESVVLLGTQRDVIRMKNREANGKVSDVKIEPLLKFSDLVQFVFSAKNNDETKNDCKEKFISFLVQTMAQEIIAESGVFSVIKTGVMQDIPFDKIGIYKVFNVFVSESEIKELREKSIEK